MPAIQLLQHRELGESLRQSQACFFTEVPAAREAEAREVWEGLNALQRGLELLGGQPGAHVEALGGCERHCGLHRLRCEVWVAQGEVQGTVRLDGWVMCKQGEAPVRVWESGKELLESCTGV